MVRLVGQNDIGDAVLVAVLRVGSGLHHDAGGEDDALEMPQARQNPLGLGGGAFVLGIKAKGAVHDSAKSGLRDLPANGLTFFVQLAACHGEALPEFAAGMRTFDHGEFAVEHPRIARLRGLQQPRIRRGRAVHTAGADG